MLSYILKLIADGTLLLVLAVSAPIVVWSLRKRFWTTAPVLIMAGLTSLLVAKLMSLVYQPEFARPFLQRGVEAGAAYIDNPGFPSDHALLATVAVIAVYVLTKNRKLAVVLGALVVIMGVGRILALVHTPLDVVGGIAAGLVGSIWYKKLTK